MPKVSHTLLFAAPALWLCLWVLEQRLVKAGVLNLKDMSFVGNETGTAWEHLTNAWHWDVALMLLFLVAAACTVIGITKLVRARRCKPAAA